MNVNKVFLTGNITRDPELKVTEGGTQVLSFGIAVNERRHNAKTGEWEDCPNFFNCTVFGRRAEGLSKMLAKGVKVAVEGKLRYSTWMKDDERRSSISVIVDELDPMSQAKAADAEPSAEPEVHAEDIPF